MKTAYFAGGCFWCIASVFENTRGVLDVVSGYCGGDEQAPTYEDVKAQKTGHRETIMIVYDEQTVTYRTLLDVFLSHVDPYDPGGQYIDRGRSYTLAVYYADADERCAAVAALDDLRTSDPRPVCVALEPLKTFYDAEEYHQHYAAKNPVAFAEEIRKSGRKPT